MTDASRFHLWIRGPMPRPQSVEERFMAKVEKTATCWIWKGAISAKGYGRFGLNGRNRQAHAVAHELFIGPIPDGLQVDHVHARGCRSRRCVNPAHLEAVTSAENTRRGVNWLREKMHCKHGHPLIRLASGYRRCPICQRAAGREHRRRERAARGAPPAPAHRTHCPQGHLYDDANTYLYHGNRQCRTCRSAPSAAEAARKKEQRRAAPSIR